MSQEYSTTPSKKIRRTRSQRNRPVLVTDEENKTLAQTSPAVDTTAVETPPAVEEDPVEVVAETPKRQSRLPNFFSRVDKSEQETNPNQEDVVQARLARATRKQAGNNAAAVAKEETATSDGKVTKARATQPPKLFKSRHFLGFAIYLLGAEFLLPYETNALAKLGLNKPLFTLPLFGATATVSTSFLFNIFTLILLLYILVKMDLLPSSLAGSGAAQRNAKATQSRNNQQEPGVKQTPPSTRQGVQGTDDDLYQEYRANQRRDKKR